MLAMNPASVQSHRNYSEKKGYAFPILSDPGETVLAKYKNQKLRGKSVLRTVYAINPKGTVIFAERGHASYDAIMDIIKAKS